jgi:hypothetical protein
VAKKMAGPEVATLPIPVSASVHQAGGGQPGGEARSVQDLDASTLAYLQQIFNRHAGTDKKWTKDQIIAFLHHVQADKVTDPSGDIAVREVSYPPRLPNRMFGLEV